MRLQVNPNSLKDGRQGYVLSSPSRPIDERNMVGTCWVVDFLEFVDSETMRVKFLYDYNNPKKVPHKEAVIDIPIEAFGDRPRHALLFVETGF